MFVLILWFWVTWGFLLGVGGRRSFVMQFYSTCLLTNRLPLYMDIQVTPNSLRSNSGLTLGYVKSHPVSACTCAYELHYEAPAVTGCETTKTGVHKRCCESVKNRCGEDLHREKSRATSCLQLDVTDSL